MRLLAATSRRAFASCALKTAQPFRQGALPRISPAWHTQIPWRRGRPSAKWDPICKKDNTLTILERFLGHDAWTTRQLLLRCRELSDDQLDRVFNIGDRSLRGTFVHMQ